MSYSAVRPRRSAFALALAPPLAVYSFVFIFPLCFSLFYAFTNWAGGAKFAFVGLENFRQFLSDGDFALSFKNTLVITVINVVGQVGLGLLIAVMLTTAYVRSSGIHRTLIFLPVIISPVVVSLIWTIIYDSRSGMLNLLLRALGVTGKLPIWLGDPDIVLFSVSIPVVWQYIGLYMVILLGALESIPKEVLESAMIDGASGLQRGTHIMIPMIWPTFKVAVMICVSGTLKIFDHIYVLTGGGPGKSSMTMTQYNYITSFNMMRFGYGSVVSIGIIVIILAITGTVMKLMGGKRYE